MLYRTTILGSRHSDQFHITKLLSPEKFREFMNVDSSRGYESRYNVRAPRNQTQWSSAPKPDTTSAVFAVGAGNYLSTITDRKVDWSVHTVTYYDEPEGCAFGVDWLNHETIVSGHGTGDVCLWDLRARGSSVRFVFPSSINHTRKLNEHQIVVAGKTESVNPPPS